MGRQPKIEVFRWMSEAAKINQKQPEAEAPEVARSSGSQRKPEADATDAEAIREVAKGKRQPEK